MGRQIDAARWAREGGRLAPRQASDTIFPPAGLYKEGRNPPKGTHLQDLAARIEKTLEAGIALPVEG